MLINPIDLVKPIVAAVKPVLGKHWGDAKEFAETEAVKTAHTLANIAELYQAKKINEEQARALLDMQRHAAQAVLLTIEGIGLLAAQRAIAAGLGAVSAVVNGVIGFALV